MYSPVLTTELEHISSFRFFHSVPFLYLSLCQTSPTCLFLHCPITPISVCCHSPIKKGNEARYQCKYLGPLAAPWLITQRQKQGRCEEDEEGWEGGRGGRAQQLGRKTDVHETQLIVTQSYHSAKAVYCHCRTLFSFHFLCGRCPNIQPVLFMLFWGVIPVSLPLVLFISLSVDCFEDYVD